MRMKDGSPTICSVLKGIRNKVANHMNNRGVGIKEKTLKDIDNAISMAKRMNDKLVSYKKESKK